MSGLEQEFPGKVKARNVDATSEEGRQAIRDLGFQSHGLVIRDSHGKPVWSQADHTVKVDEVREALRGLLRS